MPAESCSSKGNTNMPPWSKCPERPKSSASFPGRCGAARMNSRNSSTPITPGWGSVGVPSHPAAAWRPCGAAKELISVSVLCSGISEEADRVTLQTLQDHILRELRDTGFEPAFALMELAERPLAATINFQSPPQQADRRLAALADRCFAASYFRFLGLA
jgi:hypothetical protein